MHWRARLYVKRLKAKLDKGHEVKGLKQEERRTTKASKENRDIEVMFTDGGVPETERKILSVIREEDEVLASFSDKPPELNFEDVDQPKESGNSTFTGKKEIESDSPHSNHLTPNE